jgi:hypothetical protein
VGDAFGKSDQHVGQQARLAKKTCARSIDFQSRITAQHCFIVAQWGAGLESGAAPESDGISVWE